MAEKTTKKLFTSPVAEENVASLLPIVGLNGEPLTDENAEDDIVKESMDDAVINAKTPVDVSRDTRKLILNIYELRVEIETAPDTAENNLKTIDNKKKFISLKKKLMSIKNSASKELKSSINKIEETAKKFSDNEIKKVKEKKKNNERVTEGVAVDDIVDAYFTEMNHAAGTISDAIVSHLPGVKNAKVVQRSEVVQVLPDSADKLNEFDKAVEDVKGIFNSVYSKFKSYKIGQNTMLSKIIDTNPSNSVSKGVSGIYIVNNKYVVMESEVFIIYESKSDGEGDSSIATFTHVLHAVRKIMFEMQRQNKNKMVTIKIDTKADPKTKSKFIILGAYLKSILGDANSKKAFNNTQKKEEPVNESGKEISPELKRLDEKRGRLSELEKDLEEATKKAKETGEKLYENKVTGLKAKISKLKEEIKAGEEKAKKEEKEIKESVDDTIVTESRDMEEEIKPIVNDLESKGYKVKYASPGHKSVRKKEDKEPDGVYYNKLYSDARIMFDKKYDFPDAPKYWHWRDVNNCSYLDITPEKYDEKDGTPDEAFTKWKSNYMNSLKEFVKSLKSSSSDDKVEESVNDMMESVMTEIFDKMGLTDIMEDTGITEKTEEPIKINSENNLIKELDTLLA